MSGNNIRCCTARLVIPFTFIRNEKHAKIAVYVKPVCRLR